MSTGASSRNPEKLTVRPRSRIRDFASPNRRRISMRRLIHQFDGVSASPALSFPAPSPPPDFSARPLAPMPLRRSRSSANSFILFLNRNLSILHKPDPCFNPLFFPPMAPPSLFSARHCCRGHPFVPSRRGHPAAIKNGRNSIAAATGTYVTPPPAADKLITGGHRIRPSDHGAQRTAAPPRAPVDAGASVGFRIRRSEPALPSLHRL